MYNAVTNVTTVKHRIKSVIIAKRLLLLYLYDVLAQKCIMIKSDPLSIISPFLCVFSIKSSIGDDLFMRECSFMVFEVKNLDEYCFVVKINIVSLMLWLIDTAKFYYISGLSTSTRFRH